MCDHRKPIVGLAAMILVVGLTSQSQSAPDDPSLNILQRWHLGGPDAQTAATAASRQSARNPPIGTERRAPFRQCRALVRWRSMPRREKCI
jgi:hypothetical protein